jgi:hypothetical protein
LTFLEGKGNRGREKEMPGASEDQDWTVYEFALRQG